MQLRTFIFWPRYLPLSIYKIAHLNDNDQLPAEGQVGWFDNCEIKLRCSPNSLGCFIKIDVDVVLDSTCAILACWHKNLSINQLIVSISLALVTVGVTIAAVIWYLFSLFFFLVHSALQYSNMARALWAIGQMLVVLQSLQWESLWERIFVFPIKCPLAR